MGRFMTRKDECHMSTEGRGDKEGGEAKEAFCRAALALLPHPLSDP
jgi:hypothetical protein